MAFALKYGNQGWNHIIRHDDFVFAIFFRPNYQSDLCLQEEATSKANCLNNAKWVMSSPLWSEVGWCMRKFGGSLLKTWLKFVWNLIKWFFKAPIKWAEEGE